jgi:hypothetical protein
MHVEVACGGRELGVESVTKGGGPGRAIAPPPPFLKKNDLSSGEKKIVKK